MGKKVIKAIDDLDFSNLQVEFSSCRFYPITNRFTNTPSIKYSFSGRFIFLHLSSLPRSDFPGSHGAKKHYRLVLFWARALQSFIFFICFLVMAYANLSTSPKGDWTHTYHKTALSFITRFLFLSIPLLFTSFTFSCRIFLPLFVCFDILWQLATTRATGHRPQERK